ncbi:unnamed protein product [Cylindrotheca closterium]|uniref:Uncharacterized protein n=1 Tax=Cylindrotheca closterium TaxID=2856 RepID=A0AAD2CT46_9STRA|nr:unnamed protein product [Cylindrotheca closterium]
MVQKKHLGDDDDDEMSVEICLDTLTIKRAPPSPKAGPETREKRRAPSPRPMIVPQQQGRVMGSPAAGYSMRQLLNEQALGMYSDDESVYLSDDNQSQIPV